MGAAWETPVTNVNPQGRRCVLLDLYSLHRQFAVDYIPAHFLCPCHKDALLFFSSLVAKQWLFLQNWNPIPAASAAACLGFFPSKTDRHDVSCRTPANITEPLWQGCDCGNAGGAYSRLLRDLLQCQSQAAITGRFVWTHSRTEKCCHCKMQGLDRRCSEMMHCLSLSLRFDPEQHGDCDRLKNRTPAWPRPGILSDTQAHAPYSLRTDRTWI